MKNKIARLSKNILIKGLVLIIIAVFALWGIGDLFSGGKNNVIAEIGDEKIYSQDFNNELRRELRNQKISNIQKAIKDNFHYEVLNNIISDKIIEIYAKEKNIFISDKALTNFIKQVPTFRENNKFSRIKYEKFILQNQTSANSFEKGFKKSLYKELIVKSFVGGINSTKYHENEINKYMTKKIEVDYLHLNKIIEKYKVTEIEIKEYYKKDKTRILSEELREIKYSELDPDNLSNGNSDLFFKKISEIENDILENKKIDEIAEKYNLFNIKNETVNNKKNKKLDKKIIKKIFELDKNIHTEIIDLNEKFYLISLIKVIPPKKLSLNDQTRKKIKKILKNKRLESKINIIKNKLNKDNIFDETNKSIQNNSKKIVLKSRFEKNKIFNLKNIQSIFLLNQNQKIIIKNQNNFYLIKAEKVSFPIKEMSLSMKKAYERQVISDFSNQLLYLFDKTLNEKYKVKINEKVLNRIVSAI